MNIAELLQTENEEEQLEIVQRLLNTANTPVIDLLIRYENEEVSMTIIGGDVPFDVLYVMLDKSRQAIHQQEIQVALQQQAGVTNLEEEEEVEE